MSFVTQEDILNLTETLFTNLVETLFPDKKSVKNLAENSPSGSDRKYGSDKPDLRKNKNNPDELAFVGLLISSFTEQTKEDFSSARVRLNGRLPTICLLRHTPLI